MAAPCNFSFILPFLNAALDKQYALEHTPKDILPLHAGYSIKYYAANKRTLHTRDEYPSLKARFSTLACGINGLPCASKDTNTYPVIFLPR